MNSENCSTAAPKVRRVGMLTMSLSLIALGIALVLWVFMPSIDIVFIARLSPIVLVLLGIEILVTTVIYKGDKIRYDVLSVLVSILLIMCSLTAALVPQFSIRERQAQSSSDRIANELEEASFELLRDKGYNITNVDWYVNVDAWAPEPVLELDEITINDHVQVRVMFAPNAYKSAEEFAEGCKELSEILTALAHHVDYASFYTYDDSDAMYPTGDTRYTLYLDSRWKFDAPPAELTQLVYEEHWMPEERYYVSQWEYEDRLQNPEYYS